MIFKLVFILTSCATLAGNNRLEDVKKHYKQGLETSIGEEVERLLDQGSLDLKRLIESVSSRVDTISYEIRTEKEHFLTRKFKNIAQRHSALETFLQGTKANVQRIEFERSRIPYVDHLSPETVCSTYRDHIAVARLPEQPEHRRIWIDLPKPTVLQQTGVFDSEYKPAEEVGAAVFTVAASSGCGVGAAIGVWFFGIGAGAGAGTTAIMTSQHNIDEYHAYRDAYRREEARQKQDIQQTEEWVKANPIDALHLYERTYAICLNRKDWSVLGKIKQIIQTLKEKIDTQLLPHIKGELDSLELEFKISSEENQIYVGQVEDSKAYVNYFDEHIEPLLKTGTLNSEIRQQVRDKLSLLDIKWPNHFRTHEKIAIRKTRAQNFLRSGEEQ